MTTISTELDTTTPEDNEYRESFIYRGQDMVTFIVNVDELRTHELRRQIQQLLDS